MKKKKLKGHKGSKVNSVAWSADGQVLASGGTDSKIILWNPEGESIKVLEIPEFEVNTLFWSNDNKLAASAQKKIRLWDKDGNDICEFEAKAYDRIAFSSDSKLIGTNTMDYKVNIWKEDGTHIKELTGHTSFITGISWNPDGDLFLTASEDAKIRFWDPKDWSEIKVLSEHYESYTCLAWAPNGQKFVVGSRTINDQFIRIYDSDGKSIQKFDEKQDKIMSIDWSKDGQFITSGSSDKSVIFWKPDGTLIEKIKIGKEVTQVAISPDSQSLAVSCWDNKVQLYDLTKLKI
ncbi:MAG: hypothetical protein GF329_11465 [Candidatus Lokiarchaeota archaeon]|nr:hypothetical protein [Candidatus Lokiarchaeota archaeon]